MREIPIEHNPEAIEIIQGFLSQKYDAIILLTGVGTEALFDVARSQGLYDQLIEVLTQTPIIIRGPKPAAVLSKVGLRYVVRAPEPNTWRELLTAIDDATNAALRKNADLLRQNTTEIARANQRALVEMETLEHVQKQLLGAFEDVQKINEEAAAARAQTDAKLGALRDELITRFQKTT